MTDATLPRSLARSRSLETAANWTLLGLITGMLGLRLYLLTITNVNWDEFFYLSKVHDYLRGDLTKPLQSFHVHLFAWLPSVADNEVDQVIAGRAAVFTLGLINVGLLYAIGRRFFDQTAALFTIFCYLTFSYLVEHGASFRADPICALLFLSAVAFLMMKPRPALAPPMAGLCLSLAVAVSIKALLYVPVIGAIFLALSADTRSRWLPLWDAFTFTVALALGCAGLYWLHVSTLPPGELLDPAKITGVAAAKMFLLDELFPQRFFFVRSLLQDVVVWSLMGIGALLALGRALRNRRSRRVDPLLLLAFLIPLLYLPFYRNAYPYFYVFVLTPGILLAGVAVNAMFEGRGRRGSSMPFVLVVVASGVILASLLRDPAGFLENRTLAQREVITTVHRLFPRPVPYIDRSAMIASYPKRGFFMSSWGLEAYRAGNRPIFRRLILDERPLFLIANSESLDLSRPWAESRAGPAHRLLKADFETLRANYVPHWGAIYVAGKTLTLGGPGVGRGFEILIPGLYSLESAFPVTIDGVRRAPGSSVYLEAGTHSVAAISSIPGQVVLRWAGALYRPDNPPRRQPIFVGF